MERNKFRGRKKDGKWLYGYIGEYTYSCLGNRYTETVIFNNIADFCTDNVAFVVADCSVDENTVGKFTLMLDKNKKEIYEGDIVKAWSQGKCIIGNVVRRKDGLWLIYPAWQDGRFWHFAPDDDGIDDGIEVIGNIHDNIELLNI